jgi:MFS family permease
MVISLFSATLLFIGLLIGLVPTLMDGVAKSLATRLSLPDGRIDWHARLFYFSWLPAMPLAGWLIDEWPTYQKQALFFALVLLILAIAWLALVKSFNSLIANALVVGVAYSFVTTATVRLMAIAFFPTGQQNAVAGLNVGFVTVGLGALVGPWLLGGVQRWWGFRQGILYLSIAMLVPVALLIWSTDERLGMAATNQFAWEDLFADAHLTMLVVVILIYFAVENCLEFWPEKFLLDLGYRERGLHNSLTLFWLVFIGTRGLAAWWLYHHPNHAIALTILVVVLSSIVLGNLLSGYNLGSGSFGFLALAACYGPLLPTLLGIAFELHGRPLSTSSLGVLLALSGLDTLFVRPLMGVFGKDRPPRIVMRVPTVLSLLMAAPLVLILFLRR